jgi:hypothetical protein
MYHKLFFNKPHVQPHFSKYMLSCAMGNISYGSHFNFDFTEMASSVTALHNKVAIKLSPTHKHRMINAQSLQMLLPARIAGQLAFPFMALVQQLSSPTGSHYAERCQFLRSSSLFSFVCCC